MIRARLALVLVAGASHAAAQPAPVDPAPVAGPPLAQIRDEKQLAAVLSQITQDPTVPVDDPARRALAQALMIEGVKRLQAREYDQALANFLEAYGKFPSPKILLNIASTLRDMGRLSDAANTYQRYLLDPLTGSERVTEVKEILLALDQQLTILTIRVAPSGASLSIDAGPFVPVGTSLQARVRPGLHLVRIKHGERSNELTVNGFEGEIKEVQIALPDEPAPVVDPAKPPPKEPLKPAAKPPETVNAWLDDSERYATKDPTTNERAVRVTPAGPVMAAFVPRFETTDTGIVVFPSDEPEIASGVVGVVRIDGEGRGFAGGVGLAIARDRFEGDLMYLRSNQNGGYLGGRFRILTGFFRPYVAVGVPVWVFDHRPSMDAPAETKLGIGLRGAAGLELFINGHLSVQADLGYERFWFVEGTRFDNSIWIPTVGAIGRL